MSEVVVSYFYFLS